MREATRSDLPKGGEAQCTICWKLFTSDYACEAHKPYRRPQTPDCKIPSLLEEMPGEWWQLERRGLFIWGHGKRRVMKP